MGPSHCVLKRRLIATLILLGGLGLPFQAVATTTTLTPTPSAPQTMGCSGTLEVASNALDGTQRVFYDNVLDAPNYTAPPAAGGLAWTEFRYDTRSAGWTDPVCTYINEGVAAIPLMVPAALYCAADYAGGGATTANWIRPEFTGSFNAVGGFNAGDVWWTRRAFSIPAGSYVTRATLRLSADNWAQPSLNGVDLDVVGLRQSWDSTLGPLDMTALFSPGTTDFVLGFKVLNSDDYSVTGLAYVLDVQYACGLPSPTPTATLTPVGYCGGTQCRVSLSAQNRIFYDPAGAAPTVDLSGRDWKDPLYSEGAGWTPAVEVTSPPGEWALPCNGATPRRWISSCANALPPTLTDAFFRNTFTLPPGAAVTGPITLTLSADNVAEVWLNGNYLGLFEGPYEGDSHLYGRCVDVTVDPSFLRPGVNALVFRLVNQMTYHGLSYEMCVTYSCAGSPGPTGTVTPSATSTPSVTMTSTHSPTWTPRASVEPSLTFVLTATYTPTPTPPSFPTWTPTPITTAPVSQTGCDLTGWTLNGSAQAVGGNEIQFSNTVQSVAGSAWAKSPVDLSADFNMDFTVFLGYDPNGSDGIAFVLQSQGANALGGLGGGLGYGDLNGFPPLNHATAIHPSVAVEIDTHPNIEFPDPNYDHMGVVENGIEENPYANLGGVQPAMPGQATIKDGHEHDLNVVWSAASKVMKVYLDGRFIMEYDRDMVSAIFGGNPQVLWGLTGSTGGGVNLQYFRVKTCGGGQATATFTSTFTPTPTVTSTVTKTPTPVPPTATPSPTASGTPTYTPTPTSTSSVGIATLTWTPTPRVSTTPTPVPPTATPTSTHPTCNRTPVPTCTPSHRCGHPQPYPNPCRDRACFSLDGGPYDRVVLSLHTLSGREICRKVLPWTGQDECKIDWDLRDDHRAQVCNGIYYAVIETQVHNEVRRYTEKVCVLR